MGEEGDQCGVSHSKSINEDHSLETSWTLLSDHTGCHEVVPLFLLGLSDSFFFPSQFFKLFLVDYNNYSLLITYIILKIGSEGTYRKLTFLTSQHCSNTMSLFSYPLSVNSPLSFLGRKKAAQGCGTASFSLCSFPVSSSTDLCLPVASAVSLPRFVY